MPIARRLERLFRTFYSGRDPAESQRTVGERHTGRLVAEPWCLDTVTELGDGALEISGWAFPDPALSLERQATRVTVNGKRPRSVSYPTLHVGVGKTFWQRPGAENSRLRIEAEPHYPNGAMAVRIADSMTEPAAAGREIMWLPDASLHSGLPDADRRFRVIGNRDSYGFLRLGCTDAHRLMMAYELVTRRKWSDVSAVLDWGVGCGRVARHLAPALGSRFHGCDIDGDNVAWCGASLPGTYRPSSLQPPLPYADGTFDVIYGISVFTHLREEWERRWLAELHRVLRPGGTILMTIHGETAIDFAALDPPTHALLKARMQKEGLAVTSENHQLDGFIDTPSEYVNVFHSDEHIKETWSRYFAPIVHLKGYIFTHDLLVGSKV